MFRFVQNIFRKNEPVAAPPVEEKTAYSMPEVGLRFEERDRTIAVYHACQNSPFFTFTGVKLTRPTVVRTERLGNLALMLHIGDCFSLTCAKVGDTKLSDFPSLERSIRRKMPDGKVSLEFTLLNANAQAIYTAELKPPLKVVSFTEKATKEAVFRSVPPVSQMVAFLRATLHQRRTALKSLRGLARRCGNERVRNVVNFMVSSLGVDHDFSQPILTELKEALLAQGCSFYDNTLIALCLLADVFLGRIGKEAVTAYCEDETPILISEEAASAAARFLGGLSPRPALAQADLAWRHLKEVVSHRSMLTVLDDLSEDSGGNRSKQVITELMARQIDSRDCENETQQVLCRFLAANGKRIQQETVAALCLFVDFEAGIVTVDHVAHQATSQWAGGHSLYALLAVARAFDVDLDCLCTVSKVQSVIRDTVSRVLELSVFGVLLRYTKEGSSLVHTVYVRSQEELQELYRQNVSFSGELLFSWHTLDFLEPRDLITFLKTGRSMMACFRAGDRTVRWSLTDASKVGLRDKLPLPLVGEYGFIDQFRAFRFFGRVVGTGRKVTAHDLVGKRSVIVVYLDNRGGRHYHYLSYVGSEALVTTPPQEDLEFGGECAEFPSFDGGDFELIEPNSGYYLGLTDERNAETAHLAVMFRSLRAYLCQEPQTESLLGDNMVMERLSQSIRRPAVRASLTDVIEFNSRCSISAILTSPDKSLKGRMEGSSAIIAALHDDRAADVAVLIVVYSLCCSFEQRFGQNVLSWKREAFGDVILNQLRTLLQKSSGRTRVVACALLGLRLIAENPTRREAAGYLLTPLIDDPDCGEAASLALVTLALAPTVLPEPAVICESWDRSLIAKGRDDEIIAEYAADITRWLSEAGLPQELSARANLKGEAEKIQSLANFICCFNRAVKEESSIEQNRRCCVFPFDQSQATRRRLMLSWAGLAAQKNLNIEGLGPDSVTSSFAEYVATIEEQGKQEIFLHDLNVVEIPASNQLVVGPNELFLRVAATIISSNTTSDEVFPSIVSLPASYSPEQALDPGLCQVFVPTSAIWLPFLDLNFAAGLHLDAADRAKFDYISSLYQALIKKEQAMKPAKTVTASPLDLGNESVLSVLSESETKAKSLNELGDSLARAFALPAGSCSFATIALLGLSFRSQRPLPPYKSDI